MIDYSGPERRRFVRVPFIFPVKYKFPEEDLKKEYHGLSDNISEGGIKIICMQKIEEGIDIDISFSLPTSEGVIQIECRGTVAWFRERDGRNYCGVQFTDLNPELQMTLKNFIEKILQFRGVKK